MFEKDFEKLKFMIVRGTTIQEQDNLTKLLTEENKKEVEEGGIRYVPNGLLQKNSYLSDYKYLPCFLMEECPDDNDTNEVLKISIITPIFGKNTKGVYEHIDTIKILSVYLGKDKKVNRYELFNQDKLYYFGYNENKITSFLEEKGGIVGKRTTKYFNILGFPNINHYYDISIDTYYIRSFKAETIWTSFMTNESTVYHTCDCCYISKYTFDIINKIFNNLAAFLENPSKFTEFPYCGKIIAYLNTNRIFEGNNNDDYHYYGDNLKNLFTIQPFSVNEILEKIKKYQTKIDNNEIIFKAILNQDERILPSFMKAFNYLKDKTENLDEKTKYDLIYREYHSITKSSVDFVNNKIVFISITLHNNKKANEKGYYCYYFTMNIDRIIVYENNKKIGFFNTTCGTYKGYNIFNYCYQCVEDAQKMMEKIINKNKIDICNINFIQSKSLGIEDKYSDLKNILKDFLGNCQINYSFLQNIMKYFEENKNLKYFLPCLKNYTNELESVTNISIRDINPIIIVLLLQDNKNCLYDLEKIYKIINNNKVFKNFTLISSYNECALIGKLSRRNKETQDFYNYYFNLNKRIFNLLLSSKFKNMFLDSLADIMRYDNVFLNFSGNNEISFLQKMLDMLYNDITNENIKIDSNINYDYKKDLFLRLIYIIKDVITITYIERGYNFNLDKLFICLTSWKKQATGSVLYVRSEYMEYGTYMELQNVLSKYIDYIRMRREILQKDISYKDNLPLYINDATKVNEFHDAVVQIQMKVRDKGYSLEDKKYMSIYNKFIYSNEEYSIIAPKNTNDIRYEGNILHHCVGSYVKDVLQNVTNILFLRENNNINKPFYTIEILNNGDIRQVHGFANSNPTPEVTKFLLEWGEHNNNVNKTTITNNYRALCAL